jgi:methylase of polypeptide subunit release factors
MSAGDPTDAIVELRGLLEEARYALVDFRLSLELPRSLTGFPPFDALRELVGRLDPDHRALFRLLRLGEAVEAEELERPGVEPITAALRRANLLVPATGETAWRTPSLLLVPAEGLLLFAGIPESYPTASAPRQVWFDLSASVVARSLPGSPAGARVLDVCSGTGIQALLCANRRAAQVVGLDVSDRAVEISRVNAVLNGCDDLVEFRASDMLAGLGEEERFAYFVCNTPYAPVLPDGSSPSAPVELGNGVVWRLLEELPAHLDDDARGVIGLWRSVGHRGSTYQLQELADRFGDHGYEVSAYVDPAPDTREGVLGMLRSDLSNGADGGVEDRVAAAEALLERTDLPIDGFYNQLVFVRRSRCERVGEPTLFGVGIRSGQAARLP